MCNAIGFHITYLLAGETGKYLYSLDCQNAGVGSQTRRNVAPFCGGPPHWHLHWTQSSNLLGKSWEVPQKGSAACCQTVLLPATRGIQALSPASGRNVDFKTSNIVNRCDWKEINTPCLSEFQNCLFSLREWLSHADLVMAWRNELCGLKVLCNDGMEKENGFIQQKHSREQKCGIKGKFSN